MAPSRMIAWCVWIVGSIFYAYQYILRVMPNIMLGDIMTRFDIDAAAFGQFSGMYYIGYSLMHLPIGIMLDRFGPRKIMTGCILLTVIGLMPLLLSDYWVYPLLGRGLIGIGSSAAILGMFKIIRMTFAEKHFTRMLSFSVTIGLIGAIYGGGPVSYMTQEMGYQTVIKIFVGMGIILALLTYLIVPEMQKISQSGLAANIKMVLRNKKVLLTCIFAGFMVGPLEGFADVWGAAFLKQNYALDPVTAAGLPSLIFIGMCFGAPALSLIAEKTQNYLAVIVGAGLVMALSFILLVSNQLTLSAMSVSFTLVGVACAYQILAIYKASTYVPEEVAGLTTAMANMIIMSFGYAFHSLIGLIVGRLGGTEVPSALSYGVGIIPIALCIGVIGLAGLLYQERWMSKSVPV